MRTLASAGLRRLVLGLMVLGIVVGIVLAQVVPPVAAGVAVGAHELASRVSTIRTAPAWAAPAPAAPAPVQFTQVSWADIVEKAGPAVVTVVSDRGGSERSAQFGMPRQQPFGAPMPAPQSLGSGVIVDERGYLVTNNHVVAEGRNHQVILSDGKKVPARLVGRDEYSDLAVLQIEGTVPAVAPLGDSGALRAGEPVLAIGSPLGDFRNTVTQGVVSAVGRRLDDSAPGLTDLVQTDAAINQGNSGGPLMNASGQVIGINVAVVRGANGGSPLGGSANAEGLGFAIPSNTVRDVMQQLVESGTVTRPYLGVNYQTVTPRAAAYYELQAKEGALVTRVAPNSPAQAAGLQQGDVITKVDGQSVGEQKSLAELLNKRKVDETVTLTINREGKDQTLSVKLAPRPSAS